jgi:predicted dehydrogenase
LSLLPIGEEVVMVQPLRVGIISANWGVHAHLPAWRSLEDVEVRAICTSRPETAAAAAAQHGFERAYHDYRAMAADPDLDLIDVGTRPPLRYDMVRAALENGKHVYNGIPFAASLDAARDMTAWRDAAGRVGAVDAVLQAIPAHVLMKELIGAGAIGEVHGFRIAIDLPLFTQARTNVPGYVWFGDPANGASALRNNGSHMLHLLVWLFGEVEAVVADQSLRLKCWPLEGADPIEPRTPDTAFAILRFANGLAGQLGSVWSMVDGEGYRLEVWGAKGRLAATAPLFPQAFDTKLFLSEIGALGQRTQAPVEIPECLKVTPGSRIHADEKSAGRFPMAAVFRSICEEVAGRGKAAPDFRQALHVQTVLEAAALSGREGRWVRVGDL